MIIFRVLFFLTLSALASGAPEGHFWLLRTDRSTAESLQKAIREGTLPSDQVEEKIGALITRKTIEELARFSDPVSDRMRFEKDTGTIEVKEIDEIVPMGVTLEASAHISGNGPIVDVLIDATMREKGKRNHYGEYRTVSSSTHRGDRWNWHHHWSRGDDTTLLLTNFKSLPDGKGIESISEPTLFLDYELLSVSPADLTKFGKSTPATREKAINWLRGQAEILDGARITCRSGGRIEHRHQTQFLTDKGGDWTTWNGGSLLSISTVVGALGKRVDLDIELAWQDPKDPKEEEDYGFDLGATYDVGVTSLITPTQVPKKTESSLIMLVTPEVSMPERKPAAPSNPPITDGIISRTYTVEPSFQRILRELSNSDSPQMINTLLKEQGMSFPAGTSAHFTPSTCTFFLRHNKKGHEDFLKLKEKVESKS